MPKNVGQNVMYKAMQRSFGLPRKWDMSFHNCAHGHIRQCQPCISAIVSEGSPFPLVPQTILQLHKSSQKSNPIPDVQEISAMVAFVYQLLQSSSQ